MAKLFFLVGFIIQVIALIYHSGQVVGYNSLQTQHRQVLLELQTKNLQLQNQLSTLQSLQLVEDYAKTNSLSPITKSVLLDE